MNGTDATTDFRLLERLTQLRMRNFQLLTCIQCEYIWLLFDLKPPNDVNFIMGAGLARSVSEQL